MPIAEAITCLSVCPTRCLLSKPLRPGHPFAPAGLRSLQPAACLSEQCNPQSSRPHRRRRTHAGSSAPIPPSASGRGGTANQSQTRRRYEKISRPAVPVLILPWAWILDRTRHAPQQLQLHVTVPGHAPARPCRWRSQLAKRSCRRNATDARERSGSPGRGSAAHRARLGARSDGL